MDLKDILGKAKIDENGNLNEEFISDIKDYIDEITNLKSKDLARTISQDVTEEVLNEEKELLLQEYEEKFETYKEELTEKFSNFIDQILDEELTIPEEINEWASKGQKYSNLIEMFKTQIAIDEGTLDEDAKNLLIEAKDEIIKLKNDLNYTISENLELKNDAQDLSANLYIYKKCEGLTEAQSKKVISLIGDLKSKEKIDEKFDFIYENILNENTNWYNKKSLNEDIANKETPIQSEISKTCICPVCKKEISVTNNISCSLIKCPDCDNTNMEDLKDFKEPSKKLTEQQIRDKQTEYFMSLL